MITTQPQRSTVTITGGGSTGGSLAKSVAMHSGDPNLIDDDDIVWALSKWTRNQPIDGMTVSDNDMILLISKWATGASVQAVASLLSAVTHKLGAKARSMAVQSIGLSQIEIGRAHV